MELPSSIERIEPFPASALALLNIIPPKDADAGPISALLAQDPALLNAIGQVSGPEEPIGSHKLIEIAITVLVRGYLQRALSVFEDRRYWRYTVACAVSCAEIAWPGEDNNLIAYVSGLLHDIGRLALIAAYPDRYANLLLLTDRMFRENPTFSLLEHERLLFGMDHFATGSWLAAAWGLPSWLRSVTGKFDEHASSEHRDLVATTRSGTRLAHSLGFGYLQAAPRGVIREILSQVPGAGERWKTLDQWNLGEEVMRGKIQSQLKLYEIPSLEDD
jgi:hypothetical protein